MRSIVVVFSGDMFDPFPNDADLRFEAWLLVAPEEVPITTSWLRGFRPLAGLRERAYRPYRVFSCMGVQCSLKSSARTPSPRREKLSKHQDCLTAPEADVLARRK